MTETTGTVGPKKDTLSLEEDACLECLPRLRAASKPDPVTYSSKTNMHKTRWTCYGCGRVHRTWALSTVPDLEQKEDKIQCLVTGSMGTMPFQVTPTSTMRNLKTQIQHRCHLPPDAYFLTLEGAVLDDYHPLGAYRISNDVQIQIRHRGPGGMMHVPQAFQHWQQVDSFTEGTPASFPPPPLGLDLHQHTAMTGSQDDHPYMDPQDTPTHQKRQH